jgi:hypothetical protein
MRPVLFGGSNRQQDYSVIYGFLPRSLSEVAVSLGDTEAAQTIYDLMLAYKDMTITAGVATVCLRSASD